MVWTTEQANAANISQSSDLDRSYNTIEDLPTASLKEAAKYIGNVENNSFLILSLKILYHYAIYFADLLITSSLNCPNHLALSFDELAAMFLARNKHISELGASAPIVNRPFLNWLCDLITQYFQENFVIDEKSMTVAGLRLECLYELYSLDEVETETDGKVSIAINISDPVLKPSAR